MRDTKILDRFKREIEKKHKEMQLFVNLKREVNTGANGTQNYVIKKGINTGKVAAKWNDNIIQCWSVC